MKRLTIVAAVAVVLASTSGCWHWFKRSAACNTCPPAGGAYGDAYMAPSVLPGSEAYQLPTPGPG